MTISINGEEKLITISGDYSFMAQDIYDAVVDWSVLEDNMKYLIPMDGVGKAPLGGSVYTDIIFALVNGWKIKPSGYSEGDQITIRGTLITSDSSARTVSPDEGDAPVWVFQVATYGTIALVSTGSGLSSEEHDMLASVPLDLQTGFGALNSKADNLLGLSMENHVEDDIVRNAQGLKTSSKFYLYDSKAHALTHDKVTGLIATYTVFTTYSNGKMTLFRVVKD